MNNQEIVNNILKNKDQEVKDFSYYDIFDEKLKTIILDDEISEIMFNGTDNIFIEKGSSLICLDFKISKNELRKFIDFVSRYSARRIDFLNPIFDGKLPDGSRCNIVIEPISQTGTIITIRKHKKLISNLINLVKNDMFSLETIKILKKALAEKKNIIISGGTSSGKTTLMNALLNSLIETEELNQRLVIIEDTKELNIDLPHVVYLQCRYAFQGLEDKKGEINMGDLVKASLRMRPDRLILGEVRGSEAYYLLHALNTGHRGSISSIHANSSRDSLRRLETLSILEQSNLNINIVRSWISSNIDMIVHLEKINGIRKLVEIFYMEGLEPNSYILRKVI